MSDAASFYARPSNQQIEAQRQLVLAALAHWELGEVDDVILLAERENAVFDVRTSARRVVARVHRADYHTDAQLRSQREWMAALATEGVVHTAPWLLTREGEPFVVAEHPAVPEPRQVSVLDFVEGGQLSTKLATAGTDEVTTWYRELGRLAARVHEQGSQWPRPEGFACARWDAAGLLGDRPVWGSFWDLDELSPEDRRLMVAFRAHARAELTAIGEAPPVFGLVHNDLLPENLLVTSDALCLLDFDDCGDGWYVFELATALVSVSTRDDYPLVKAALLDGYRERRALPRDAEREVPLFFALRMATYAGWMQTRRHTQFARDLGAVVIDAAVDVIGRYMEGEFDV